jgi:type II secretory ATPase GspE/PulE/Tfp pilus assembly ATPase PilB-like protein
MEEAAAFVRGSGGGLSLPLVLGWWAVVLAGIRAVDWVCRDATRHRLAPAFWVTVTGLVLCGGALLAWWIPSAIAAGVLLVLAVAVPPLVSAVLRNRKVAAAERVLTPGHARRIAAGLLAPLGIDLADAVGANETDLQLPAVELAGLGGQDVADDAARLERARAKPGFETAVRMLQDAVASRATTVSLECRADGSAIVRQEVDGVWDSVRVALRGRAGESWEPAAAISRDAGLAIGAALATLANVTPTADKPAAGLFGLRVDGKLRSCRLSLRTAAGGPQAIVRIESPPGLFRGLADAGMPVAMTERLAELLALEHGLIVLASPPGNGLSTTFDLVVGAADRMLRDFVSLEDAAAPPRAIQNVRPVQFDHRKGVSPLDALTASLREYPKAIVTRDLRDKPLLVELVKLASGEQLVVLSMKAADAVSAVAQIAASGPAPDLLGQALVGVVAQRLVRKLCPKCRQAVAPSPELLARLKRTPAELPHIQRAAPQGCGICRGTGYLGRTAIFELASGAQFRRAVSARAQPQALRDAAVRDGMRPLTAAGLALVADGVTSVEEIQRALAPPAAAAEKGTG